MKETKIESSELSHKNLPVRELRMQSSSHRKLGIALVGLGKYGTTQVLPAIIESENYKLVSIVTGSPEKSEEYASKYSLNVYNYENFDMIKFNQKIDVVYITLPNFMHAEYTIRALEAGKHVICEKPMAISSEECKIMIETAIRNKRLLFIGYRLHFEPFNLTAINFSRKKIKGEVKSIIAQFGFEIDPHEWRLNKQEAGGGSLFDVGIYTIQAACYIFGTLPIAIRNAMITSTDDKKFRSVEGDISWEMEFPNDCVAYCASSYTREMDRLYLEAENGWLELSPAFYYQDLKGKSSDGPLSITNVNQQKAQLDGMVDTIKNRSTNFVPGAMGLRDLKIMETIYEAANKGKRIELNLPNVHFVI